MKTLCLQPPQWQRKLYFTIKACLLFCGIRHENLVVQDNLVTCSSVNKRSLSLLKSIFAQNMKTWCLIQAAPCFSHFNESSGPLLFLWKCSAVMWQVVKYTPNLISWLLPLNTSLPLCSHSQSTAFIKGNLAPLDSKKTSCSAINSQLDWAKLAITCNLFTENNCDTVSLQNSLTCCTCSEMNSLHLESRQQRDTYDTNELPQINCNVLHICVY